jgi:hypothetical protein
MTPRAARGFEWEKRKSFVRPLGRYVVTRVGGEVLNRHWVVSGDITAWLQEQWDAERAGKAAAKSPDLPEDEDECPTIEPEGLDDDVDEEPSESDDLGGYTEAGSETSDVTSSVPSSRRRLRSHRNEPVCGTATCRSWRRHCDGAHTPCV